MYTITGNNLFQQWCTNDVIITQFRDVPLPAKVTDTVKLDPDLVEIHWTYNIYEAIGSFYISGFWGGRKEQFKKVTLPQSFNVPESQRLLITGNDYNLFIVEETMGKLWIMDENNVVREIKFSEMPIDSNSKRRKESCKIRKLKATGDNLLCLTDCGTVYMGMLPSLVSTTHCIGSICDIDCGFEHFLLLTDAGRVYTWGNGRRLQLGHGGLDNLETPTEVEALAGIKIVKIGAGGWHSAALSEFGDLYVWGWNDMGQLGIQNTKENKQSDTKMLSSAPLPTLVDVYDGNEEIVNLDIKDFACGSRHTAIILEDNTVWISGCNKYGQLGVDPNLFSKVCHFRKNYKCNSSSKLLCGPWSTVIINR